MGPGILSGINPNYAAAFKNTAAIKNQAKAATSDLEANRQALQDLYAEPAPVQLSQPINNVTNNIAANLSDTSQSERSPTQITVYAKPEPSLSPYQQRLEKPYEVVNNDFFGSTGSGFKAILDTINPLQQIPVVGTIYREMTGDTISSGSRIAGGTLFGGPVGFALSVINEIVSGATGKDLGANLFAAVTDKYKTSEKLA